MNTSKQFHMMPVQFGPIAGDTSSVFATGDKTDVTVQIEVDTEAARSLLPTWQGSDGKTYGFRPWSIGPSGQAMLMVNYTQERDVDYMAGGGYNEVEFYLSAEFIGENPWLHEGISYSGAYGMFAVLLLPSSLIPLLVGRDVLGTPKLLADVKNFILGDITAGDEGRCGSFQVHDEQDEPFLAGLLRNIRTAPAEMLEEPMPAHEPLPAESGWGVCDRFEDGVTVMLWKYVAAANWADAPPDLCYAVAARVGDAPTTELIEPLVGDGSIVFPKNIDSRAHPDIAPPIAALKKLIEEHGRPFPGNVLIRRYRNVYRSQDLHIMDGPRPPRA